MTDGPRALKTAFDRLLQHLDPDRDRAGEEKYENTREKACCRLLRSQLHHIAAFSLITGVFGVPPFDPKY